MNMFRRGNDPVFCCRTLSLVVCRRIRIILSKIEDVKDCEIGWYQELSGNTTCRECPIGYTTLSTGASSCDVCAAGYSGWSNLPLQSLISLIDARDVENAGITPTETAGITDLSGKNGMTWTRKTLYQC